MFPNYEVRVTVSPLDLTLPPQADDCTVCNQLWGSSEPSQPRPMLSSRQTAVERDNVQDPFVEVTMFKRNFDHVIKEVYFKHYKCVFPQLVLFGTPGQRMRSGEAKTTGSLFWHCVSGACPVCRETSRGNPNYFLTYGNGKAAARIVRARPARSPRRHSGTSHRMRRG